MIAHFAICAIISLQAACPPMQTSGDPSLQMGEAAAKSQAAFGGQVRLVGKGRIITSLPAGANCFFR